MTTPKSGTIGALVYMYREKNQPRPIIHKFGYPLLCVASYSTSFLYVMSENLTGLRNSS